MYRCIRILRCQRHCWKRKFLPKFILMKNLYTDMTSLSLQPNKNLSVFDTVYWSPTGWRCMRAYHWSRSRRRPYRPPCPGRRHLCSRSSSVSFCAQLPGVSLPKQVDWDETKPDRQWRSSSFQESKKVRVPRDPWPWPWAWAHPGCTATRTPSCASLVAIRPIVCEKKRFAQKFTDRQTGRRRTPRHCISLFLEWAKNSM